MQPSDLIFVSRSLLELRRKGKPRQADLNRALSTAYFAMFHALCRNCADCLVGKNKLSRSELAWIQAYRAVEHGFARNQCRNRTTMEKFPEEIRDFASNFVDLQEKRHLADYDPSYRFTRNEVLTWIEGAETTIKKLQTSQIEDRKAFAVWTAM